MRSLTNEELRYVAGGTDTPPPPPPPETKKGNNGWGNGAEGINAGSDDGGTAGSKIDESWDGPEDGPAPSKFTTR